MWFIGNIKLYYVLVLNIIEMIMVVILQSLYLNNLSLEDRWYCNMPNNDVLLIRWRAKSAQAC